MSRSRWKWRSEILQALKWLALVVAIVFVVASLVWLGLVSEEKQSGQATETHFLQIATAIRSYTETVAFQDFERIHPASPTGLSTNDVPSGTGRLPFPVRRAGSLPLQDWLTRNGGGRALYSWRVELLPYLEGLPKSWDPQEPWDSAINRELLKSYSFFSYEQSKASASKSRDSNDSFSDANAVAITGPGTAFGDGIEAPKPLRDIPPCTIIIVESRTSGIPWPSPGDLDVRTMPFTINAPDGKGIFEPFSRRFLCNLR